MQFTYNVYTSVKTKMALCNVAGVTCWQVTIFSKNSNAWSFCNRKELKFMKEECSEEKFYFVTTYVGNSS